MKFLRKFVRKGTEKKCKKLWIGEAPLETRYFFVLDHFGRRKPGRAECSEDQELRHRLKSGRSRVTLQTGLSSSAGIPVCYTGWDVSRTPAWPKGEGIFHIHAWSLLDTCNCHSVAACKHLTCHTHLSAGAGAAAQGLHS